MRNVIFLAPPSAGKGTFSSYLEEHFSYQHFSTGSILREKAQNNEAIKKILESGEFVSDEIILKKAKSQGLRLACLSQYYHQDSPPEAHTFVMNYSAIHPEHMKEAIARLCQIFIEN